MDHEWAIFDRFFDVKEVEFKVEVKAEIKVKA